MSNSLRDFRGGSSRGLDSKPVRYSKSGGRRNDFSFQPTLDRNSVLALAELQFVERRQCVHLLGPPGTGKSHLAIALGIEAVKAGKSVFFATLAELVDSMRKAEREGKLRERVKFLSRYSLLIVDEIGYLPVGSGGGNLLRSQLSAVSVNKSVCP